MMEFPKQMESETRVHFDPLKDVKDAEPLNLLGGLRYLFRDALRDFKDAVAISKQRRDGQLTRDEFETIMANRFPSISQER